MDKEFQHTESKKALVCTLFEYSYESLIAYSLIAIFYVSGARRVKNQAKNYYFINLFAFQKQAGCPASQKLS